MSTSEGRKRRKRGSKSKKKRESVPCWMELGIGASRIRGEEFIEFRSSRQNVSKAGKLSARRAPTFVTNATGADLCFTYRRLSVIGIDDNICGYRVKGI